MSVERCPACKVAINLDSVPEWGELREGGDSDYIYWEYARTCPICGAKIIDRISYDTSDVYDRKEINRELESEYRRSVL